MAATRKSVTPSPSGKGSTSSRGARRRSVRARGSPQAGRSAPRRPCRCGVRQPHDDPARRDQGRHAALQVRRQSDPHRAQNLFLRTNLTEFHSGYRVYSVAALTKIRFRLNSNLFHFDTEIIIQLLNAGQRIIELPIPTYYGERDLPRQRDEVREGCAARDAAKCGPSGRPSLSAALRAGRRRRQRALRSEARLREQPRVRPRCRGARRAVIDIGAGPGGIAKRTCEEGLSRRRRRPVPSQGCARSGSIVFSQDLDPGADVQRPAATSVCCCLM